MSPTRLSIVLALGILRSSTALGDGPADPLFKLVPADAALTVAVEDLRGQARALEGSPVAEGLRALPSVRDWLASDRPGGLRAAFKKAEAALGEDLPTLRDGLLGEAVVLALRVPPGGRPEDARGLLLVRAPDGALLRKLVGGLNDAQRRSGSLVKVADRTHNGTPYHAREFRPGRRPTEYYANLDDRAFAWSNSEDLIRGAIDLQARAGAGGLADRPEFRTVRGRLPSRAVASLFIDPRFVERLLASSPPKSSNAGDEKVFALVTRYVASVRYAGAALEWRDGVILHTEEVVDPSGFPPALKHWAARADSPDAAFRRVPPSALLMATGHLDFGAVADILLGLFAERDRPKRENLRLSLNGLLLGLDARADILPRLGPGALAYVEAPESLSARAPVVVSVERARGEGSDKVAAAVENGLRTALALYALDDAHGGGQLRVESRESGGVTVTALSSSTPFAYAVADGRIVLGNSAEAVGRWFASSKGESQATGRIETARSIAFPGAVSFAAADLRNLHTFAARNRTELARALADRQHRTESDALRDLDQVLTLVDLFDVGFLTSAVSTDLTRVVHGLGVVRIPR